MSPSTPRILTSQLLLQSQKPDASFSVIAGLTTLGGKAEMPNLVYDTRFMIIAMVCLADGIIAGCTTRSSNEPPFVLGRVIESIEEPPQLTILTPNSPVFGKPKGRCVVSVGINPSLNAPLPYHVSCEISTQEKQVTWNDLEPHLIDDRTHILRGVLRLPDKVGIYQLMVHCDYVVGAAYDDYHPERFRDNKTIRFTTQGPSVQVKNETTFPASPHKLLSAE